MLFFFMNQCDRLVIDCFLEVIIKDERFKVEFKSIYSESISYYICKSSWLQTANQSDMQISAGVEEEY